MRVNNLGDLLNLAWNQHREKVYNRYHYHSHTDLRATFARVKHQGAQKYDLLGRLLPEGRSSSIGFYGDEHEQS